MSSSSRAELAKDSFLPSARESEGPLLCSRCFSSDIRLTICGSMLRIQCSACEKFTEISLDTEIRDKNDA